MPNPLEARWNDGSLWGPAPTPEPAPVLLTSETNFSINTHAMEYWEITKQRAQQTLPVWTLYLPTFKVAGQGTADLTGYISGFEGLVQARTQAQDDFDEAFRAAQNALLRMKVLGTKVPAIIEAQLDENAAVMKNVDDLYLVQPRAEASILKRLRMLLPVWTQANAALAAMTPPEPPITRTVGGVAYTVATALTLLQSYTGLVDAVELKQEQLDKKRAELRAHDHACDMLNKRWYKAVKASHDPGSDVYEALAGITTEPTTPAPETIEINTVVQGGEDGLQALVS